MNKKKHLSVERLLGLLISTSAFSLHVSHSCLDTRGAIVSSLMVFAPTMNNRGDDGQKKNTRSQNFWESSFQFFFLRSTAFWQKKESYVYIVCLFDLNILYVYNSCKKRLIFW